MKIDNIFSALTKRRTANAIKEFVLWCVVCFVLVLSIIAAALSGGNATWILMVLFAIGMGVIMAFRLRMAAILYGICAFQFLTFLIHFVCYSGGDSVLNIVLFVLLLLLTITIIVLSFVHFFSKVKMGKVLTILTIVDTSLIVILQIMIYFTGSWRYYFGGWGRRTGGGSYWTGTIAYWMILVVVVLLYAFFVWNNSTKTDTLKITDRMLGIQGVAGVYKGHMIPMKNGKITLGADYGVMVQIQDKHVSGKHCEIRFNDKTGFYEILDTSAVGVFLSTGYKLQQGTYSPVHRGSVICIGSPGQQFQLM